MGRPSVNRSVNFDTILAFYLGIIQADATRLCDRTALIIFTYHRAAFPSWPSGVIRIAGGGTLTSVFSIRTATPRKFTTYYYGTRYVLPRDCCHIVAIPATH